MIPQILFNVTNKAMELGLFVEFSSDTGWQQGLAQPTEINMRWKYYHEGKWIGVEHTWSKEDLRYDRIVRRGLRRMITGLRDLVGDQTLLGPILGGFGLTPTNPKKPTRDPEIPATELPTPKEGGPCPEEGCIGKLELPPVEGCTCHIDPPCSACINNRLTCSTCGWEEEEA